MKVALYARVSKALDQTPENQLLELRKVIAFKGWEIEGEYVDEISSKDTRPKKEQILHKLRTGQLDGVCFTALDRWGRTMSELALEIEEAAEAGWQWYSYKEAIDLQTPGGRLMARMLGAFANFERDMIHERTMLGLARARAQGKTLGRPRKSPPAKPAPSTEGETHAT